MANTEVMDADVTTEDLADGGLLVPAQATGEAEPLSIDEINPSALALLSDYALEETDERTHEFFGRWFADNERLTYRGTSRESVVNAEVFLLAEYRRRGSRHKRNDELTAEARKLQKSDEKLAPIHASGDVQGEPVALREVLDHCKSFKLRYPIVYLVGGLANRGETTNDIDLLIKGPLGEELEHALKFRLGRMFPPELSQRIQFLDDEYGGPFTNHVELADLVVEMRPEFRIKQMALEKQDDPLLDLPPKDAGPRPSVLQAHFRGKSLHGDLRIKVNEHLVGWTLAMQKAGAVPDVETIEEAKRIGEATKPDGTRYTKPFRAPSKIFATPKSRQPKVWLEIGAKAFPPGEVGATTEEQGIIVAIDRPKVEFGLQKPFSHEYFFSSGKVLQGIMHFRQLVGEGGDESEMEAGRRAKPGETFWNAWLSKDLLPSVLERRAVRTKSMPPDGYSAIPRSLERVTPKEFRYWEKNGEQARQIRDALVESRFFTEENVKLVDGEFRRVEVEKRLFLYEPSDDETPEPFAKRFREYLAKQPRKAKFALSWQYWKGQSVIRTAPSRQVWHLILDGRDGLETWVLGADPVSESPVVGVETPRKEKALLEFDGDVAPGEEIGGDVLNDTKATPSAIRIQDTGKVEVLDDQPTFKKLRFDGKKLKGIYTLVAEEEGSRLWQMAKGEEPGRAVPAEKRHEMKTISLADGTKLSDVQVWDPAKIGDDDDRGGERTELRPLALYRPMKVAPRRTNSFLDPARIRDDFATDELLGGGVWVEPKYNGFRISAQKGSDGRVLLVTEEIFDRKTPIANLADILQSVRKELEALLGPYVLDGEFVAMDENNEPIPRRELARFRGKEEVDDSGVRLQFFDTLYHPKHGNVTDWAQDKRRGLTDELLDGEWKHLRMAPAKRVESAEQLKEALKWAATQPWSEGAMLKGDDATYSLGGESDLWAKWKASRSLLAIVHGKEPVKDMPDVWNYLGAIGPVPKKDAADWKTVKVGRRLYVPIGVTANSRLDLKIGDTMLVDVLELLHSEGPPKTLRWFGPATIAGEAASGEKPSAIPEVLELLREGERKALLVKRMVEISKTTELLDCLEPVNAVSREAMSEIRKRLEADGEQRLALGVVLEPETEDSQKDVYSAKEVRCAAERYARDYERLKLMHKGEPINDRATMLGSYITSRAFKFQGEPVGKGTWLMALSVPDDGIWDAMRRGDLTGLSIGGDAIRVPRN